MEEAAKKLGTIIRDAVKTKPASGILFSGGLDSTILASLGRGIKAITISLGTYGEDIAFSKSISRFLQMEHRHKALSLDEAIGAVPDVIRILQCFDPAIPNDIVVYFGLKMAREMGIDTVVTGDGSDELFAGYDYMRDIDDLDSYIKRIAQNMRFSSNLIAEYLGIKIVQPFMDDKVIDFALSIRPELKLKMEGAEVWGKWILRKAFEDSLPKKFIWQSKRPLEVGSGMTNVRRVLSEKIPQEEFDKTQYLVKIFNREHLYYYKVYRSVIGDIPAPRDGEKRCIGCGTGILPSAIHCRVCGYVYDWK